MYYDDDEIKDVKSYAELFDDDDKLRDQLSSRDPYGFADGDIEVAKAKRITKNNWPEYIKYLVANGANQGRATKDFFDGEVGSPYGYCSDNERCDYIIRELKYKDFDDVKNIIKRCIYANNYAIIKNKLGEVWSFEWGRHSDFEVIDDLPDEIDGDGDIKKLFASYDAWKPSKEFEAEAKEIGIEALDDALRDAKKYYSGKINYCQQIRDNCNVNPYYFQMALSDEKIFNKYYKYFNYDGIDEYKSYFIENFIKNNN